MAFLWMPRSENVRSPSILPPCTCSIQPHLVLEWLDCLGDVNLVRVGERNHSRGNLEGGSQPIDALLIEVHGFGEQLAVVLAVKIAPHFQEFAGRLDFRRQILVPAIQLRQLVETILEFAARCRNRRRFAARSRAASSRARVQMAMALSICPAWSKQSARVVSKTIRSRCVAGVGIDSAIVLPCSAILMAAGKSFSFLAQSVA